MEQDRTVIRDMSFQLILEIKSVTNKTPKRKENTQLILNDFGQLKFKIEVS